MDHIVDVRVVLEHLVECSLVGDIDFVVCRALAGDDLDAVEDFF